MGKSLASDKSMRNGADRAKYLSSFSLSRSHRPLTSSLILIWSE